MSKRAQLKHLLIDVDFFEKPKIKALEYDHGSGGVCFFIAILCDMARGTDSEISASCIKATGRQFGFDKEKVDGFIQYLVKHNLIHKCSDPEYFANRRILEDQESMALKQDKWRNAKRKQRDILSCPSGQKEDMPRTGRGHVKSEDLKSEDLKSEDLNASEPPGIPQPARFLDYVYFDEIQLDAWRAKLTPEDFTRCCEKLNGWIGQSNGDPIEFDRRVKIGRNANYAFQSWVVKEVANEKKTGPPKTNPPDKPRPRLKEFTPEWEKPGFKPATGPLKASKDLINQIVEGAKK